MQLQPSDFFPLVSISSHEIVDALRNAGVERGSLLALAIADEFIVVATQKCAWQIAAHDPVSVTERIESSLRPRWVWWSRETPELLADNGVRIAMCWDIATVHRLLFGGWRTDIARVWAQLNDLSLDALPRMGQMDLLDASVDEGSNHEDPQRPDGHLRPEWINGAWREQPGRAALWARLMLRAVSHQRDLLQALPKPNGSLVTARSESATELLCVELERDGLPMDTARAEEIIAESVGPRPVDWVHEAQMREERDRKVLSLLPPGDPTDLRNPAQVKTMLAGIGLNVTDTRAWRLEQYRSTHPLIDALLKWRKSERVATTFGYGWLDEHVRADSRLHGAWLGSDGAAGRMTAQAGLHNLPAEMRDAVAAEEGFTFVHADLGQIEPRVLAAVSGDMALAEASRDDDLYAPIASRLKVDRPRAKIAVLAAMYGQTSGTAGQALAGMEQAYPTAIAFLSEADRCGRTGIDVRTYGGRKVRMSHDFGVGDQARSAASAQGRYARNAVIQGAAAELFKTWAAVVRGRIAPLGGYIVLCLHDELLLHVPIDRAPQAANILEDALTDAARIWMPHGAVRYVAKASVVDRWSHAK
jgi:DNA polymerase I